MILIQLLLITAFAILLGRLLRRPTSSPTQAFKKVLSCLFILTAIGFVVFPDAASFVAHEVGVGRGADLLLYILTVAVIVAGLNYSVNAAHEKRRMVDVVRRMAILEANVRHNRPS